LWSYKKTEKKETVAAGCWGRTTWPLGGLRLSKGAMFSQKILKNAFKILKN
jgi:hypothetical protein